MTTTQDEGRSYDTSAAIADFNRRMADWGTGGYVTLLIDVAHRSGALAALADASGTSDEIATRAGLSERHVRELLGGLVSAGVVTYDPHLRTYELPAAHAVCLTGDGASNWAPRAAALAFTARYVERVVETLQRGGGIPYDDFRPDFTTLMDDSMRRVYDALLVEGYVPAIAGLQEQLTSGARVADIGCGTGHTTNLLARAFPRSSFVGFDIATDAIEAARREAMSLGLTNVRFELEDVSELSSDPTFDVIFAFDAIHDQRDPAAVLRRTHDALASDGRFVMIDIYVSSNLEDTLDNPLAPQFFAASLFHCMQVSLAEGGTGLGTCWGWQVATRMLDEAGFSNVEVIAAPAGDPVNAIFVGRRADGS